jgi:hypothetical protein
MSQNVTVAYWQNLPEDSFWIKLTGDKRHWDEQYINTTKDAHLVEMMDALYDDEGAFKGEKITNEQARELVTEGAFLIACGVVL